jgi:hypothetical protein
LRWWPWVSREAYRAVMDERDHLRGEIARLTDVVCRIGRVEAGLAEVPRPPRLRSEPVPGDVLDHCNGWLNPSIRKHLRDDVIRRHAAGESWGEIRATLGIASSAGVDGGGDDGCN